MAWEIAFLEWINNWLHASDFINKIIKYFSVTNDIGLLWIVFGIVLICIKKYRKIGIVMLVSLLVGFIINDLILKKIIMRMRPYEKSASLAEFVNSLFVYNTSLSKVANKLIGGLLPGGSSFPSGHTCTSFNCACFLFMTKEKKLYVPAFITAILMGLSRLFLCVHYPTDVLSAMILGGVIGILMHHLLKKPFHLNLGGEPECA